MKFNPGVAATVSCQELRAKGVHDAVTSLAGHPLPTLPQHP